jgi:hypothetical protein
MTANITQQEILDFLTELGKIVSSDVDFYLVGGSALLLLGSPRGTIDIDYTTTMDSGNSGDVNGIVSQCAELMNMDVEEVPIGEFIPLPPDAISRRKYYGHFGNMDVYIYDLYSIALSKIARGFESDIEDVIYLLKHNYILIEELENYFNIILPNAPKADIDRKEFIQYFNEVKKLLKQNNSERKQTPNPIAKV